MWNCLSALIHNYFLLKPGNGPMNAPFWNGGWIFPTTHGVNMTFLTVYSVCIMPSLAWGLGWEYCWEACPQSSGSGKRSTRWVPKLEKPKGSEKLRCRHAKSNYDSTNSPNTWGLLRELEILCKGCENFLIFPKHNRSQEMPTKPFSTVSRL